MKHYSTSFRIREKASDVICPSEETLLALRLFARVFDPRSVMLEN